MEQILDAVMKAARGDFSGRVELSENNSEMDALALGINMMIEDIEVTQESLKQAREKAEESDRLKSAFLANMSHEIRTPMNHIVGFIELLFRTPLTLEQKQWLEMMRTSGDTLLTLLGDIVDLSKIEVGQMGIRKSACSLPEIFEALRKTHQTLLETVKPGIRLILKIPETPNCQCINTDPLRLRQILTNLLTNAVKFTNSGSITFGYGIKDEETLEFFVEDTGPGVAPELAEVVFHRFRQADNDPTRQYQGAGLGLTIARGLVELMGGKIRVVSGKGKGARFVFTLPFEPASGPSLNPVLSGKKGYDGRGLLILIAEDDGINRMVLEKILIKSNHRVALAFNGREALEACAETEDIAAVLMDIRMPDMDGYAAAREIKAVRPEIPIIALTGFAMHGDREKALEAGMDDYLSKPIKVDDLLAVLSSHLDG